MRLGQMARKFGVTQGEIVRYLTGKNIRVEEGSNVKLGESQVRLLYAHFAPGESFEDRPSQGERTASAPPEHPSSPAALSIEPATEGSVKPSDDLIQSTVQTNDLKSSPFESDLHVVPEVLPAPAPGDGASTSSPETIRASKIELAGLKVIGKIELPEPKKKDVSQPQPDGSTEQPIAEAPLSSGEQPKSAEASPVADQPKGVDRPRRKVEQRRQVDERGPGRNQGRDRRPRNNPIAAQREREQQEELERRKEKAAQDKERRTQNYNKRVQHSPPTKAVRLVGEPVEEMNEAAFEERPKTWFGKLIKWLGL